MRIIFIILCYTGLSVGVLAQDSRRDSLRALRDTAKVLMMDTKFFRDYALPRYEKRDTSLDKIRLYEPTYDVYNFNSSLGTVGTAPQPMLFRPPSVTGFDHGFHAFDCYWFDEDNIVFYRTKRPFTEGAYSLGSKSEQTLTLLHTQQIVNGLQAGLEYRHLYSNGFYDRQDVTYNSFRIFTTYFSKNDRYKMSFHFTHNDSYVEENGGLQNDSTFILNGTFSGGTLIPNTNREVYPVNLRGALNRWYNNALTLQQSFTFLRKAQILDSVAGDSAWHAERPPLFTMVHKIHYNNAEFRYRDDNPNPVFYGPALLDTSLTRHSTYYQLLDNEVKFILYMRKKFESKSPLVAGVRHQLVIDNMAVAYNSADTLEYDSIPSNYTTNNLQVFARFRFDITSKIGVEAYGHYFLAGYNQNDFTLGGELFFHSSDSARVRHLLSAGAEYRQFRPAYVYNRMNTNHVQWQNDFAPQRVVHVFLKYQVPEWKLWLRGNVYLLNNHTYFDTLRTPQQLGSVAAVFTAEVYKDFRFWKFHFNNRVTGQYASTDVIRVPNLVLHSNLYFESLVFKKSLLFRIGVDVWFFTQYRPYAYDPLTAQFYLQDERQSGNYPFIDVYVSGKIKWARLFFRVRNVNQRLPDIPYFLTPGYPMQDRSIQFGVTWGFYN